MSLPLACKCVVRVLTELPNEGLKMEIIQTSGSQLVVRVPLVVRETFLGGTQWWILGEANEAVASGPPSKIPHIVSFCCIRFFRDNYEVETKSGK